MANSSVDMVSEDEMQALAESIKKLERLILKSKATAVHPEDLLDMTDREIAEEDDDMQKGLLALATPDRSARPAKGLSAPATSPRDDKTDKDMETELARIQGILGSVLKKRKDDWSSEDEIKRLRAQLEEQEGTVSLRKADASFLQKQLEEKDDLLQEVSKLLEAVEVRQSELERENQRLRDEIAELKEVDDLDFSKASC
jgi:septal ring factor EnvC (AmiA/AmiB activator)